VLLDPCAGETAQDLAMAVLRGNNVDAVAENDIVVLADRALSEGRARRVIWMIEQVHEYRGLAHEFLVVLRDRLAASDDASVRVGAVHVGALLPRLDVDFAQAMFGDICAPVRAAVAEKLEQVNHLDRDQALRLISNRLSQETHRSVLSDCYAALATLIRRRSSQENEH
jgi:hypothetical protein